MSKMQNIEAILKDYGLEIPADKKEDFRVRFHENYKTVNDYSNLQTDRDNWKGKAETAEKTLKKFDGVDLETMQTELATWRTKAENAEKDYAAQIAKRDFEDALKEEIGGYKFTSEAAKKAIMAEIREAGLKVKDGKILGLSDLLAQMREKDASAFVDRNQEQLEAGRAKPFTGPLNPNGGGAKKMTREEIFGIKDRTERQKAIAENLSEFQ